MPISRLPATLIANVALRPLSGLRGRSREQERDHSGQPCPRPPPKGYEKDVEHCAPSIGRTGRHCQIRGPVPHQGKSSPAADSTARKSGRKRGFNHETAPRRGVREVQTCRVEHQGGARAASPFRVGREPRHKDGVAEYGRASMDRWTRILVHPGPCLRLYSEQVGLAVARPRCASG